MVNHEKYMQKAIDLAIKAEGHTSPNPLVGAVIVKNEEIIGEGYHKKAGDLHGERNAIKDCLERGNNPEGSTMYVTLEPCCHYGKTPPCTEAIIKYGISQVVVGSMDPNPKVKGKGIKTLQDAGITVITGVLEDQCNKVNEIFMHYISTGLPFVMMKYAMTMDGKIATSKGESRWITGEKSRENVHKDRNRFKAIMVGVGTVIKDDPMLNCRIENGSDPIRIICDSHLRTPLHSKIVNTANEIETIIATTEENPNLRSPFLEKGCQLITVTEKNGHLDLKELISILGKMEIDSILLEGGGTLNWSALESGVVQQVKTFIAPKIFGGENSISPVRGPGVDFPKDAFMLKPISTTRIGQDIVIISNVSN